MPPGLQGAVEMGGRDGEVQGRFDLPFICVIVVELV